MSISLLTVKGQFQILPPFKNAESFEDFIVKYFNLLEEIKSYSKFGRRGQKQYGLDIFSQEKKTVIQCKLKILNRPDNQIRNELIKEIDSDFRKFQK